jgi:hypothetical protein
MGLAEAPIRGRRPLITKAIYGRGTLLVLFGLRADRGEIATMQHARLGIASEVNSIEVNKGESRPNGAAEARRQIADLLDGLNRLTGGKVLHSPSPCAAAQANEQQQRDIEVDQAAGHQHKPHRALLHDLYST